MKSYVAFALVLLGVLDLCEVDGQDVRPTVAKRSDLGLDLE
jgi:hypothetical protein